ncbi:Zinc finger CCCH domain-containing protein 5 [Arabidopsis thaliana]|uniref:Zinc finger CCCH domain-containing protein 5 n=2 Tax=Arabidopsis thaliana TaxID=3702 RepID=C3H5_ARATH|nr:Zinc finger C-x8-C-x5-C-x3-H type family protein [Arabidopsis thaliana]Q9SY74.2 RecName: Full=Zinc finger CCCH domain-containing protein 5; Short=AtC3H5 [Arabidopsis thaliana]AEE28565.1 Zinc finger C-x8-C-x5-C-x3-H type family protein [Arabidopsis thaliana]|eukprot:NP_172503.1 Zinc finger C-x8-C-x5-C-x3-H type family protein [Arabidopsis thaliana]
MEQANEKEEEERHEEAAGEKESFEESKEKAAEMSRKEKRKAMKKLKRKQVRKEIAAKEREEAKAKLNDPAEQERLKAIEEEDARRREKELKDFEESERAWREAMEIKRKKEEEEEAKREEEERRWKDLEELRKLEASGNDECGEDEDGEYEYIEEGPPEIIFQGNEIILKKNKVRVPKKSVVQVDGHESSNAEFVLQISDRPTSNPLPPGSEASANYQNVSSAQQILESVAQEVPNFGTEQDKAHCPFHLKTGACRFGQRCSRVHFYPNKSCTLLMKNMYNGPGITWEQDEGLEYTDEEAELCYEEFYEDVHTEFLKYGELVNFKVCRNGSFHLKGNVYVHYRSLESAILAYQSINGRYFAGKQVNCEFVNISRWKVAICGEYMKSRLKTCSRGSACNFIHCFRNPGGDYEWADHDRPPPRFWIHKMTSLFGYSDEKHMEHESSGSLNDSISDLSTDSHRQPSRRSRSRDHDHANVGSTPSYRSRKYHGDTQDSTREDKLRRHAENCHDGDDSPSRDGSLEREMYKERRYAKDTLHRDSRWSEHSPGHRVGRKRIHGRYSDDDSADGDDYGRRGTGHKRKPRRGTDSGVQEQMDNEKDRKTHRSSRKHSREGSSADKEEGHEHDRVHTVSDKSHRERSKHRHERSSSRYSHEEDSTESRHHQHKESDKKRSVETSPVGYQSDKDRDRSKQRQRYKSDDPESDQSRKGKRQSEENSDRETHKERRHRHRKRRRTQNSDDQNPKESEEVEEEIERWRPV